MDLLPLSVRELVADWNRCHGAFYQLNESDLLWHFGAQNWLSYQVKEVAGVRALLAIATPEGIRQGVSQKSLWLSLHGEIPAGKEEGFLLAMDQIVKEAKKTRLFIGGEEFHLIPGIPEPAKNRFAKEVTRLGFAGAEAADFAGSLVSQEVRQYIEAANTSAKGFGWKLATAISETDLDALGVYLCAEFPGRWEREFRFWRSHAKGARGFWNLLRDESGSIRGFSRLAIRGNEDGGWSPGALRFPLESGTVKKNTDSCLGPIGISGSERGKGAGKVLLGLSLELLFEKKAERVCIDWTNAYNYYKPLGLPAVRTYLSAWKDY